MPSNVVLKRVKEKVKNSYIKMAKQKVKDMSNKAKQIAKPVDTRALSKIENIKLPPIDKKEHWLNLLDLEHADALISDAFWYIICKVCNPKPEFEQHQEFLLDRIAANFVSFTLIEDRKFTEDAKKQFFKKFYDIISQAVFYSLFYAYPKSRKSLDD